jgi:hypothetical protein
VRQLYDLVAATVRSIGPVTILPEKTRIAFQVRMSFAQVTPRKRWLDGHVVLARRLEHPRFRKIETFSPPKSRPRLPPRASRRRRCHVRRMDARGVRGGRAGAPRPIGVNCIAFGAATELTAMGQMSET